MKYEFKKSNSAICPPVIDKTSSATGVYYRKNITQKTDEDGKISYEYDEILLPKNGEFEVDFEIEDLEVYAAKLQELIDFFNNKERAYYDSLYLTAADVERALYKAKQIDFDDVVELAKQYPQIDIKALKIELKANHFYRGNPYINQIGALLGFTSEQLDNLFKNGTF